MTFILSRASRLEMQKVRIITKSLGGEPLITVYALEAGGAAIVIDPGPASLHSPLEADAVLCTHLHLDHCGSAGYFGAPVYAHERYAAHLLDPSRLYEAARAVLGRYAEAWGAPPPCKNAVGVSDGARLFGAIDVLHAPGHAPHHVAYYWRDGGVLFVGDGAGGYIPELGAVIPVTPPPLRLDLYLQSLERMRAVGAGAICYSHYSCTRDVELLEAHRQQVRAWAEVLGESPDVSLDEAFRLLAREDENAARVLAAGGIYADLYLRVSVLGFLDYLRRAKPLHDCL